MKQLPDVFALNGSAERWYAMSASHEPHDRRLVRQQLSQADCDVLTVASDEAPIVPKFDPPLPEA